MCTNNSVLYQIHRQNFLCWVLFYVTGEWEYREVQQDEATQMPVTIVKTKQSRRDMFRAELTLIEYPGKFHSP